MILSVLCAYVVGIVAMAIAVVMVLKEVELAWPWFTAVGLLARLVTALVLSLLWPATIVAAFVTRWRMQQ